MARPYLLDDPRLKRDLAYLLRHDRVFSKLDMVVADFQTPRAPLSFAAMIKTIIGQQISVHAAAAILIRVKDLCGGHITPKSIVGLSDQKLRAVGLSLQKVHYSKELARAILAKEFSPRSLKNMTDERVIDTITQLHGFGVWSAQMMLIFTLARPDIWPVGDLGLQIGAGYYLKRDKLSPSEMEKFGQKFAGKRAALSLLLWRYKATHEAQKRMKKV